MGSHLLDWMSLLTRWLHMTAGIAWIGASFYFNWLENSLNRLSGLRDGIAGNLWAIHGGGFYYLEKYKNAPTTVPKDLHWFKWEAYVTWLSGITLLAIIYYARADQFLLRPAGTGISQTAAIAIGLGSVIVPWFVYDCLCRTRLIEHGLYFAVAGIAGFTLSGYVLEQFFSSRGAYIHIGAMIGTMMVGNVFRVIIPSQKAMVASALQGIPPNPTIGQFALKRSRHNNYLTLPVLFIMISSHYPMTYGHPLPWLVLGGMITIGMTIRYGFNVRKDKRQWRVSIAVSAFAIVMIMAATFPQHNTPDAGKPAVAFSTIREIFRLRCISCHSASPTDDVFKIAPLGIEFDHPIQFAQNKNAIHSRVVDLKDMPFGNKTGMTPEERTIVATWISQGAQIQVDP